MIKYIYLIFFLTIVSCSPVKKYYKIESVKAIKVKRSTIDRIIKLSPYKSDFLELNKGGYVIFNGKNWSYMDHHDFKKIYQKNKNKLWTRRQQLELQQYYQ